MHLRHRHLQVLQKRTFSLKFREILRSHYFLILQLLIVLLEINRYSQVCRITLEDLGNLNFYLDIEKPRTILEKIFKKTFDIESKMTCGEFSQHCLTSREEFIAG